MALERVRSDNFKFEASLPPEPVRPSSAPGTTDFAAGPAAEQYRSDKAGYDRQMSKIARELKRYLDTFDADWGHLELDGKKPSKLMIAVASMDAATACRVVEVAGKCTKACFDTESYAPRTGGWPELVDNACVRNRLPGYKWVQTCKATFTCDATPALRNDTPGLKYVSDAYSISFSKKYVEDEPGAREFQERVGAFKACDTVQLKVSAWRYRERWTATSSPDSGWPEKVTE